MMTLKMNRLCGLAVLCCAVLLAAGCSDYTVNGKQDYQAPLLSGADDAATYVDLRGNIDFGQQTREAFSKVKPLTGFVFDALPGARVTVTAKVTNGEDPVLVLYGPSNGKGIWGASIAVDDDGLDGLNSAIRSFDLTNAGRYLVAVATYDGVADGEFDIALGCFGNCAEPNCEDVLCDLYCPNGFMTDSSGCPICRCAEGECQTDADCEQVPWSPLAPVCLDGRCVYEPTECDDDTACPAGYACVQECVCNGGSPDDPTDPNDPDNCVCTGRCQPTGFECRSDEDCFSPDGTMGHCIDGLCVNDGLQCQADSDCPEGFLCELVYCSDMPCEPDYCPPCGGVCVPMGQPECGPDLPCPEGFECMMECWGSCDPNGECFEECHGRCVPGTEPVCQVDSDCIFPDGVVGRCVDGRCVYEEIPCDDTTQCPPGFECAMACWDCDPEDPNCVPGCSGFCVPGVEPQCYSDWDCRDETGQAGRCVNGQCVFEPIYCRVDWECPEGSECDLIECAPDCPADTDPLACCWGVCQPTVEPECQSDQDCISAAGVIGRCIAGRCVYEGCNCPEVWEPVCGADNRTYPNPCFADCAGVPIAYPGECGTEPGECIEDRDCPAGFYCEHCLLPDGSMGPCLEIGRCMPLEPMQCQTDAECPEGFRCEPGLCTDCDPATGQDCGGECWGQCVPLQSECIITGCSGEICAPFPVSTSCIWLPEFECLRLTTCEMLTTEDGQATCGFVQTDAYLACLANIQNADQCNGDIDCPPGTLCQFTCDAAGQCFSSCLGADCVCPEYFDPVCGADGQTYDNICFLDCARMELLHWGRC